MATTILCGTRETTLRNVTTDEGRLWIPLGDLERSTGWALKPQGLCQAEVCVPVPSEARSSWIDESGDRVDLEALASHLRQPIVHDEECGVAALGETVGGSRMASDDAVAPDFTLPDLDGKMHSLSQYRGKKVLLFSWASW